MNRTYYASKKEELLDHAPTRVGYLKADMYHQIPCRQVVGIFRDKNDLLRAIDQDMVGCIPKGTKCYFFPPSKEYAGNFWSTGTSNIEVAEPDLENIHILSEKERLGVDDTFRFFMRKSD